MRSLRFSLEDHFIIMLGNPFHIQEHFLDSYYSTLEYYYHTLQVNNNLSRTTFSMSCQCLALRNTITSNTKLRNKLLKFFFCFFS